MKALSPAALCIVTGLAAAQTSPPFPTYPEGAAVPRHASPEETAWEAVNGGPQVPQGPFAEPVGPLSCPGEYEPADGILFAWESSNLDVLKRQMVVQVTNAGGANAYIAYDTAAERDGATGLQYLAAGGANMSRVVPIVRTTDTIWIRDYGPRYTYEGDVRVISDHTYNRPTRVNDNNFPPAMAALKGHAIYTLPLVHGGGNYHLNSQGRGFATQLIVNENPGLSASTIISLWRRHWGPVTTLTAPFPASIDSTQHIDMWMMIVGDQSVVISDWPNNPGSAQDVICDTWAVNLAAGDVDGDGNPDGPPWQVRRVNARNLSGVHYTFTNMVVCNDLALVPQYSSSLISPWNAGAVSTFQDALGPGVTVVPINCDAIVPSAGVMHCIVMHVPAHRGAIIDGGRAPTAYLRTPQGGPGVVFQPGQVVQVNWIADDDVRVQNATVELSTDGGQSWQPVSSTISDTGQASRQFAWSVPDLDAPSAFLRVVVRDEQGRAGSDACDLPFRIAGTPLCIADFNNDDGVDDLDIAAFFAAFEAGDSQADVNGDDGIDDLDIGAFFAAFEAGCGS